MELLGNFNLGDDKTAFSSSEKFVIAFMGSGQVACFDDDKNSGFANIDPAHSSVKIINYPMVLEKCMSYRISWSILTRLQDVLGIHELSQCAEALVAALGITLAQLTPGIPYLVASCVTTFMEVQIVIQSVHTAAAAVGTGNKYDKAEAFAHDATMLAVSLIFLWGMVSAIKNCVVLFKSASQNLIGRASRLTASEVTQTYKGARLITSLDDFAEYAKGFLDEDALLYAREVLGNDADDIAKLKNIAQPIEDGSKKIGKKLSKEELKAGLDALWNDGGVEGALAMMEYVNKGTFGKNVQDSKLARLVNELYRSTAVVGDGGTADMLAYEFYTNSDKHLINAKARITEIKRLIASGKLGLNDLDIAEALLNDLEYAVSLFD